MTPVELRPHDLIRLARTPAFAVEAPAWVGAALRAAPFVVVRRAVSPDGRIPVGVRGAMRIERHASWLTADEVAETITPEMLAAARRWRELPASRQLPAFAMLDQVAAVCANLRLPWGPAGAVGFELASGHAAVHAASDLDLVLRPRRGMSGDVLERFAVAVAEAPVRIDAVLELADGGCALDEFLRAPERVLLKTPDGPRLAPARW